MMERITSRQNALLSKVVKLQTNRKFRYQEGLYVGDGTKLLYEAVKWAPEALQAVILREDVKCPELPGHVRAVQVSRELMTQISMMEAPEGALFVMKMPEEKTGAVLPGALVLDGIQDPGNVGTILRTADAMEVPVLLSDGCADPYNPKTVRATMGAVFRNPPRQISHGDLIASCREKNISLLATALSPEAKDLRQADLKNSAVIIGSEGQGVSRELLEASCGQIIIPMSPRCESLNAASAASIVLWQMTTL